MEDMEKGVKVVDIWRFEGHTRMEIPLFTAGVSAGFPSPADDFVDRSLDLNEFLIKHPSATFFVRVDGTSMLGSGIHPGDILIVDRALEPYDNSIVIAVLNGEFTVKRFRRELTRCYLLPENPDFEPIKIGGDMQLEVWGVVTSVIHKIV
jgi:DNA polymerase V